MPSYLAGVGDGTLPHGYWAGDVAGEGGACRSIYAAWECGDFSSAEWADPEIEYATTDGPLIGTWRGLEGMAEAMREFLRAWEDWRVTAEDFRELDAEHVLVPFQFSGRGKTSRLELGQIRTKGASLFHVRDGKVTRLVQYFDRERALADQRLLHAVW